MGVFAIIFVLIFLVKGRKKDAEAKKALKKKRFHKFNVGNIETFFLLYSTTVKVSFQAFSCIHVDGDQTDYRLHVDMAVNCYTSKHNRFDSAWRSP